jgi:hypothetical protein
MPATQTPFGLKPIITLGGAPYNGGAIRQFKMRTNIAVAIGVGQVIQLATNAVPTPIAATPVAPLLPGTTADATAGIIGVCVGLRYIDPAQKQFLTGQYLPANAITAGYSDVWVFVNDDPNQLYMCQADTAMGTFDTSSGEPRAAIGRNVALKTFTVNATTGVSNTVLDTGSNWGSVAATSTLAMRIVDVDTETEKDTYKNLIVKFNAGLHAYHNPLGL